MQECRTASSGTGSTTRPAPAAASLVSATPTRATSRGAFASCALSSTSFRLRSRVISYSALGLLQLYLVRWLLGFFLRLSCPPLPSLPLTCDSHRRDARYVSWSECYIREVSNSPGSSPPRLKLSSTMRVPPPKQHATHRLAQTRAPLRLPARLGFAG